MTTGTQGRLPINIFRAALCLLLAAAATSLGGAVGAASVQTRGREKDATSMRRSETHISIRRSADNYDLAVTVDGALEFTDDEADVQSISGGGRLLVKERRDGKARELEVVGGADGAPRRSYFVQGHSRAFDQEAREWLARLLPGVIRNSGLNAAARVRRILGERGVDGILREIALIESDGVKRIYFDELLRNRDLDAAAVGHIILQSAREIASDGEKANLLIDHSGRLVGDAATASAIFDAVDTINSDGERARALSALLRLNNPTRDTLLRLLKSAARISSDGEKANVLVMAARLAGDDPTVRAALYDAARTISSDAERERVISALDILCQELLLYYKIPIDEMEVDFGRRSVRNQLPGVVAAHITQFSDEWAYVYLNRLRNVLEHRRAPLPRKQVTTSVPMYADGREGPAMPHPDVQF